LSLTHPTGLNPADLPTASLLSNKTMKKYSTFNCTTPPVFSPEMITHIVKGAKVLKCAFDGRNYSLLMRLSKGNFYAEKGGDREFEYIIFDFDSEYSGKWYHASSHIGGKRDVEKRWLKDAEENRRSTYLIEQVRKMNA